MPKIRHFDLPIENAAFLVVDPQNDFCPGGALPVTRGDEIFPTVNATLHRFETERRPIFVSRDWHPEETEHFKRWPKHCVQNTHGAEFHPLLQLPASAMIVSKGTSTVDDGYSAFGGRLSDGRTLEEAMRALGITTITIAGLATDYCVKATCLDAILLGFKVVVLDHGIRAVNVIPYDGDRAIAAMILAGATLF